MERTRTLLIWAAVIITVIFTRLIIPLCQLIMNLIIDSIKEQDRAPIEDSPVLLFLGLNLALFHAIVDPLTSLHFRAHGHISRPARLLTRHSHRPSPQARNDLPTNRIRAESRKNADHGESSVQFLSPVVMAH